MQSLAALADLLNLRGLLLVFLVFAPLEQLMPLHEGRMLFRRARLPDLLHAIFSGLLIKAGLIAVLLFATALASAGLPAGLRSGLAAWPLWAQVPAVLLIADLGFYGAHRVFHAVPWLWRYHAVHHSIEEMDWLAAHRVHPFDQIATKSASLVPVFALGFSDAAVLIFAVLYHWQSLLIHSNFRIRFGPLRWLVASPEFHHWHHANQREAFDKNFSGQLPLWDLIFGTAYMPHGRMPERYGTDDPVPASYIGQLAYPFRRRRQRAAIPEPGTARPEPALDPSGLPPGRPVLAPERAGT